MALLPDIAQPLMLLCNRCGRDLQGRAACGWRSCGGAMLSDATSRRPGCWARCWARCRWTRSTSKPSSGQQGPGRQTVTSTQSLACGGHLKCSGFRPDIGAWHGLTCANMHVLARRLQLPVTAPSGVHRGLRAAQADLGITVCIRFYRHRCVCHMLCGVIELHVGMR